MGEVCERGGASLAPTKREDEARREKGGQRTNLLARHQSRSDTSRIDLVLLVPLRFDLTTRTRWEEVGNHFEIGTELTKGL